MFKPLALSLLGTFQVHLGGEPLHFPVQRAKALLSYLAMESETSHPRTQIASMLWPDAREKSARDSLRQTLSLLRKALKDKKSKNARILANREQVTFEWHEGDQLDVWKLQDLLKQTSDLEECKVSDTSLSLLESGITLIRGSFLSDLNDLGDSQFEEWRRYQSIQLQRDMLSLLERLTEVYLYRQRWNEAEQIARQQLSIAPWHEQGHFQLMKLFAMQDKRADALHQYSLCFEAMREELGVRPSSQLQDLHRQIRDESLSIEKAAPATLEREEAPRVPPRIDSSRESSEEREGCYSQLPKPFTAFVGRKLELQSLYHKLSQGQQLITILGIGGIGKTRLAQRLANKVQTMFKHGVVYVSLVGHNSLEQLISAIGESLRLPFGEGSSPKEKLLKELKDKHLLLVLDNMEQLVQEEIQVFLTSLLEQAADLQLVVTSREPLYLGSEYRFPLEGIGKKGIEADALALFEQQLQRCNPVLLEDDWKPLAGRICEQLAWVPLAMELAASLTTTFSLRELLDTLSKSVDILESEQHDLAARHRSLRSVFQSSWESLSSEEQKILSRCSVFEGGFSLESSQAVTQATPVELARLVSKSLIAKSQSQRYQIHELIRQYAAEQLQEAHRFHALHAKYYTDFLTEHLHKAFGDVDVYDLDLPLVLDEPDALGRLQQEDENLQAAWRWNLKHESLERVRLQLEGMWSLLRYEQRWSEALEMCNQALEAHPPHEGKPLPQALWKFQSAFATLLMGKYPQAWTIMREAAAIMGEQSPQALWSKVLMLLGHLGRWFGKKTGLIRSHESPEVARLKLKINFHQTQLSVMESSSQVELFRNLLVNLKTLGDETKPSAVKAVSLAYHYFVYRQINWRSRAERYHKQTLQICDTFQSPALLALCHFILVVAKISRDPWVVVEETLGLGLEAFSPSFYRTEWFNYSHAMCIIKRLQGKFDEAWHMVKDHDVKEENIFFYRSLYSANFAIYNARRGRHKVGIDEILEALESTKNSTHYPLLRAAAYSLLGWLYLRNGDPKAAWESVSRSLTINEHMGVISPYLLPTDVYNLDTLVSLYIEAPDSLAPYTHDLNARLKRLLKKVRAFGRHYSVAKPYYFLHYGRWLWHQEKRAKAERCWIGALGWSQTLEMPFVQACVLYEWGKRLEADREERQQKLEQAATIFQGLNCPYEQSRAQNQASSQSRS